MKKRVITGVVYVIVMVGLLALKLYVPTITASGGGTLALGSLGIDVLFWAISVIGAFEFLRAVQEVSTKQRWVVLITCALIIPAFVVSKICAIAMGSPYSAETSLTVLLTIVSIGMMVTASLMVFDFEKSSLKSTALAEMCILYCGVLPSVTSNINHMNYLPVNGVLAAHSNTAILFLFIIMPLVDSFAFFFGRLFGKKLPLKLAPHTSPNKTVIGAVGGIIGGVVAAVLTWLICEYLPGAEFVYSGNIHKLLVLVIMSLPTAVVGQLGDLFESAIKRGCNVKDMGNVLPGHGGVLDRFDSTLFASVSVVVCFMIIR